MTSWRARLGLVVTMLGMLLAVSIPAVADEVLIDPEDCEIVDEDGDGIDDISGFFSEDAELLCDIDCDDFDEDAICNDEDDDDDDDGISDDDDDDDDDDGIDDDDE